MLFKLLQNYSCLFKFCSNLAKLPWNGTDTKGTQVNKENEKFTIHSMYTHILHTTWIWSFHLDVTFVGGSKEIQHKLLNSIQL